MNKNPKSEIPLMNPLVLNGDYAIAQEYSVGVRPRDYKAGEFYAFNRHTGEIIYSGSFDLCVEAIAKAQPKSELDEDDGDTGVARSEENFNPPTHEEIESARDNARLDAQAEREDQIEYETERETDYNRSQFGQPR